MASGLEPAIARGLAYLAKQQQADGSFQNRTGGNSFAGPKVALTGLSLMAYLSAGRMPDAGKHSLVVRGAIDYLVKACPEDGYFGKVDGSRMYGHAIATLALAEVAGMEFDEKQRKRGYRAGYRPAASFLLWLERTRDPEIVRKLNAAVNARRYSPRLFREWCGKPLDALWSDFVAASLLSPEAPASKVP